MPINSFRGNAPYGTAWNGLDDDDDWGEWADEFGWWDDDDNNCPDGASQNPLAPHPCWADQGEWGFINYNLNDSSIYQIYEPYELMNETTILNEDLGGNSINPVLLNVLNNCSPPNPVPCPGG